MTKSERIEDLGRLREKLNNMFQLEIFNVFDHCRPKDINEWFSRLSIEKKWDILHNLAYGLGDLQSDISDCLSIARGDEDE